MHGVAPQMCRSGSPSIVRRRSRRSLPRLHLKLNDFWQFTRLRWRLFASQRDCEPGRYDCEQEETVTSWYDWRMAFAWLMAIAIASAIYFFPIARLVDSLGD
jgi:hypothetical protein